MKTIPGTQIPLCLCCEDSEATHRDSDLGRVCAECAGLLGKARAVLANAGIVRPCEPPIAPKKDHPDQSDPSNTQPKKNQP